MSAGYGWLLRAYPRAWRDRYGEEFLEVLRAETEDRRWSWRTTADILGNGVVARLRGAGITGPAGSGVEAARTGLASMACAAMIFLTFGLTMWSQVVVGWRWEPPGDHAVTVAMVSMSVMTALVAVLLVLAAGPVLVVAVTQVRRRPHLALPLLSGLAAGTVLVVGSAHFGGGWPGTGGHPWRFHAVVPTPIAADVWAGTVGVSSYWAHPAALQAFPAAEVLWMVASPLMILVLAVSGTVVVRRLSLSARLLRYEAGLARIGIAFLGVFLAGATCWVVAGGAPGPTGIYRVGFIDVAGLAVMALAVVAGVRAGRRMRVALA